MTSLESYCLSKECLLRAYKEETLDESVPPEVSTEDGGGGITTLGSHPGEPLLCALFPHQYLASWQCGTSYREKSTVNCE